MYNNDKTNGYNCLKVSKFDHSSTTPRATRWREWVVKLRYAFGSAYPLLANQTSEVLDPLNYWWGLTWSPLLDLDNMNQEQEQKLYVDFQKAQYSLLHVLSENFGTHEKQIIADHDPVQLVEKLKTKYLVEWSAKLDFFPDKPGWTPTHWMTTWLPFDCPTRLLTFWKRLLTRTSCLMQVARKRRPQLYSLVTVSVAPHLNPLVTVSVAPHLNPSALDDVPATVREQNHNRKPTSLKKNMALMSSVRNKQKREALLQQANALLADMADAPAKKNKKKNEEEHEAGLAELTVDAPTNYELSIHAPKPKPTKKAQVNELDRMLANCTVQGFAGCSVPSNLSP
jgi:hypothetical protein